MNPVVKILENYLNPVDQKLFYIGLIKHHIAWFVRWPEKKNQINNYNGMWVGLHVSDLYFICSEFLFKNFHLPQLQSRNKN